MAIGDGKWLAQEAFYGFSIVQLDISQAKRRWNPCQECRHIGIRETPDFHDDCGTRVGRSSLA